MNDERKSNFDLLKIIAMFLIVLYHCYLHSNFIVDMNKISVTEILIQSVSAFGVAGNVIFTLISGYFLINSKNIKLKKIIQIVLQVWFYSFVFLFIFLKLNIVDIETIDIVKNLMPLSFGTNWYITFYFLLYLLSPYINIFLRNMSKEQYKKFLLILFLFFCVFGTIDESLFLNSEFVYYIFIYCVGAYIRINENYITINKKKSIILYILSIVITIMAIIISNVFKSNWNRVYELVVTRIFKSHWSVLQFFIGLFMFLMFKNINIKNNKLINKISNCTLGIYLLHENYFLRKYIWKDIFKLNLVKDSFEIVIYILFSCLIIFIICIIIELIRKNTIEKFYMKIVEKRENEIEKFKNKIGNFLNKILIFIGLEKNK